VVEGGNVLHRVKKDGQLGVAYRGKCPATTDSIFIPPVIRYVGVRNFVLCPRSSVVYVANNSRTQRPSVPKFGRKVPHL